MPILTQLLTSAARLTFARRNVPPPSQLYVGPAERLSITSISAVSSAVAIQGRILQLDGQILPFSFRHQPAANRVGTLEPFWIGEGWLLGLSSAPFTPGTQPGALYCHYNIIRGDLPSPVSVASLAQGYISDTTELRWPPGTERAAADGPGFLRSITGTDPAPGAEISETVPTGAIWRLHGVAFRFTASAVAATRFPTLIIDDGANILWRGLPNQGIIAGNNALFCYAPAGVSISQATFLFNVALPHGLRLLPGWRIRTQTTNGQAGDDYSQVFLYVEEWVI